MCVYFHHSKFAFVALCVERLDEVKPTDGGFPLWLVILLILASLSVIVVSTIVILTLRRRLTTAAAAAVKSSTFARMESGNGRLNLPNAERRVWTNSHLEHSLPPAPHTAINMHMVSLEADC